MNVYEKFYYFIFEEKFYWKVWIFPKFFETCSKMLKLMKLI